MSFPTHSSSSESSENFERSELEAVLETRRELGAELEPALVDSFAERIERVVEARVRAQYEVELERAEAARHGRGSQLALAIVSVTMAIPLTAIAVSFAGLPGMLAVWVGIVLVNFAMAMQRGRGNT